MVDGRSPAPVARALGAKVVVQQVAGIISLLPPVQGNVLGSLVVMAQASVLLKTKTRKRCVRKIVLFQLHPDKQFPQTLQRIGHIVSLEIVEMKSVKH